MLNQRCTLIKLRAELEGEKRRLDNIEGLDTLPKHIEKEKKKRGEKAFKINLKYYWIEWWTMG